VSAKVERPARDGVADEEVRAAGAAHRIRIGRELTRCDRRHYGLALVLAVLQLRGADDHGLKRLVGEVYRFDRIGSSIVSSASKVIERVPQLVIFRFATV
jgi:hypothetical protein